MLELVTIGLPREPWDFVKQAALVGHPCKVLALHQHPAGGCTYFRKFGLAAFWHGDYQNKIFQ